ncbi:MAG: DUF4388 domain-containing protein [Planctomycetota bacterium]
MIQGSPNPWTTTPPPGPGPESIVSSYCRELEKLAATLSDLIEVSGARRDAMSPVDLDAFRHMTPALERLDILVSRVLAPPPAAPTPAKEAAPQSQVSKPEPAAPAPFMRSLANEMDAMTRPGKAKPAAAPVPAPAAAAPTRPIPPGARPQRSLSDEAAGEAQDFMQWVRSEVAPTAAAPRPGTPQPKTPLALDELLPSLLRDVAFGVSIQGTTESMPMKAVFQLIEIGSKSGCLHVRTPTEHARFVFDAGRVVAATTDEPQPGGRVGDLLVRLGAISPEALEKAVKDAEGQSIPLGEALLRARLVTTAQLEKALSLQLVDHFERFEREPLVAYALVPNDRSAHDGKLRMTPRELLLEAARRADEHVRKD